MKISGEIPKFKNLGQKSSAFTIEKIEVSRNPAIYISFERKFYTEFKIENGLKIHAVVLEIRGKM